MREMSASKVATQQMMMGQTQGDQVMVPNIIRNENSDDDEFELAGALNDGLQQQ
jgi:hypothetical protein